MLLFVVLCNVLAVNANIFCSKQTTCSACVSGEAHTTSLATLVDKRCRWCAQTQTCHAPGFSDLNTCPFPLIVQKGTSQDLINYYCEAHQYSQTQTS